MVKDIFKRGKDLAVYIIAEIGINHNGDLDKAKYLIDEAKISGADAVKFQAFKPELLIPRNQPKMPYQKRVSMDPENQFEMLKKVELNEEGHKELIQYCRNVPIDFISTPYDRYSVDMLIRQGVEVLKIASTDTTNIPLLRYVRSLNVPIILSTGVTDLAELTQVMDVFVQDKERIALLHCVSNYPAPMEELNLRCIRNLEEQFQCPVGFSDHTLGIETGAYAVCAGACILEKHFTFDRNAPGPDHAASLIPQELRLYVNKVREVEKCLGDGKKRVTSSEKNIKGHMQKSIVAGDDLSQGEIITEANLWTMRPATGISPLFVDRVIGKRLKTPKSKFEQILWEDFDDA